MVDAEGDGGNLAEEELGRASAPSAERICEECMEYPEGASELGLAKTGLKAYLPCVS